MENALEYFHAVNRTVHRKISNHEDAEDVISNVFLSLHTANFKGKSKENTFVYSIMKNKINDHFQAQYRRKRYRAVLVEMPEIIELPDPNMDLFLQECKDQLSGREREIINLYYADGYTGKEISEMLGLSERTISLHKGSALRKMFRFAGSRRRR